MKEEKTAIALYYCDCKRYKEAVKLLTEAADAGDVEAMYNLARYTGLEMGLTEILSMRLPC